ncbi:MAG: hypothetical protein OEV86_16050 [Candidatus Krumholzibacteria bacterium]|nr:hypothetical protein [Candidatus Krumholzibacteria bacterium]
MYGSMKEWLDGWDRTEIGLYALHKEIASRIDAMEDDGRHYRASFNEVFSRLQKLEQFSSSVIKVAPKPEPQGVYVREGMQVETKEGNIFTVRKNHPVAGYEDCIDVWLSNGSHGVIRKGEITYGGRPVLGYVEDRP